MPRKANQKVQRDTEQSMGTHAKVVRRDKTKRRTGSLGAPCEDVEETTQQPDRAQRLEDDPSVLIGLNLEELSELKAPNANPVDGSERALLATDLVQPSKLSDTMAAEHKLECSETPAAMVSEQEVEMLECSETPGEMVSEQEVESWPQAEPSKGLREGIRENPTLLTSPLRAGPYEDDLMVAESMAKARGLPPDLEPEAVRDFLLQYGYKARDHQCWVLASTEHQPQLMINLSSHIEFGNHTQYELECRVQARPGTGMEEIVWRTIRRLKHLRGGLHDPVKRAFGSQYNQYFGSTPFAHHTAPAGTTARLKSWFGSLATCISSGILEPHVVAHVFRVLDGPGTPLHTKSCSRLFSTAEDFEQIPVTAAMFGSKHLSLYHRQGASHCQLNANSYPTNRDTFYKDSVNAATLELAFDIEGSEKKVRILQRPLGAEFSKRSSGPLTIRKVQTGSHSEQLGLQNGWTLISVGGIDVRKMTFEQAQDAMKSGLMRLPHLGP